MSEFGDELGMSEDGQGLKRGDRVVIMLGGRDVPAVATSDVLPEGVIHVAYSTSTARVPVSAVRRVD